MVFYFFKFGYIGSDFTGFQRGNGNNSIEDCIDAILVKNGVNSRIQSAARTDRGVSALGNVFMIETTKKPADIAGIINSSNHSVFIREYAYAGENNPNPRHCTMKVYRYFIFDRKAHCDAIMDLAKLFTGTHDFTFFSRRDERNPIRTIEKIECDMYENSLYLDFYGKSFVWNQIRSVVGYILKNAGNAGVSDPFSLKERYPYVSDPHNLVLMDIFYDGIIFTPFERKNKKLKKILEQNLIRSYILSNVTE